MILVTGGAGFIGSNLVAALAERGHRVVVCDRLRETDKWRNLAKSATHDIVPPELLADWLEQNRRLEAVFHMGAISSTTVTDGDLVFDVNVRLSTRLWDWCAEHAVPFIYASSAATYGNGEQGFEDDASLQALARLRPLNAYGWSKHYFDQRVVRRLADGDARPPQWAGLKFFNVYGPNEYHKGSMRSVVAQKYPLVAKGQPVTLFRSHNPRYEDGGQLRDFVYVRDCVDVMLWLLEHRAVNGLFNLGSGRARSFLDLARAIATAVGRELEVEFIPTPEEIRPNYQYYTQASMSRLQAAGYAHPFTSLEDGVLEYVQRYLSQPDRYR